MWEIVQQQQLRIEQLEPKLALSQNQLENTQAQLAADTATQ